MGVLRSTNVLLKVSPQFLGESQQNFILIIYGVLEEWYQFFARAVRSKCERDGGDAMDGVEAQLHIL